MPVAAQNIEQRFNLVFPAKVCPYCHSDSTYLLTGNEYIIKEIEAE